MIANNDLTHQQIIFFFALHMAQLSTCSQNLIDGNQKTSNTKILIPCDWQQ